MTLWTLDALVPRHTDFGRPRLGDIDPWEPVTIWQNHCGGVLESGAFQDKQHGNEQDRGRDNHYPCVDLEQLGQRYLAKVALE